MADADIDVLTDLKRYELEYKKLRIKYPNPNDYELSLLGDAYNDYMQAYEAVINCVMEIKHIDYEKASDLVDNNMEKVFRLLL